MANLHLVTGHAGEPHVKATDDASLMQAVYGGNSVVLDRNNAFSYDVISNNIIRVYDGEALMQGRYIKMEKGNYVDLTIDNGHTGYRRIDVIAIEYSKNDETNIEEANLVVIRGSETQQEEANVPQLIVGDTVDGSASINQMALYRVIIDGLSIAEVTKVYTTGKDLQTTEQNLQIAKQDLQTLINTSVNVNPRLDVSNRYEIFNCIHGDNKNYSETYVPQKDGVVNLICTNVSGANARLTYTSSWTILGAITQPSDSYGADIQVITIPVNANEQLEVSGVRFKADYIPYK
jgi:hypothetical protein